MFGLFEKKPAAPEQRGPTLPQGFRLGGAVEIEQIRFRANEGAFNFAPPEGTQIIETLGTCDLGDNNLLYCLYLSDDAWVQLNMVAGDVAQKILFTYEDTINPPNERAFNALLTGENPKFGQPTYVFRNKSYQRVWGNNESADELTGNAVPTPAWAGPVEYGENVISADPKKDDYSLTHYCWLYQRELPELPGRFEYLLISGERYETEWMIVINVGTDVTEADLKIT